MVRKIRRDNLRSRALHRGMDVSLNWLALLLAYVVKEGLSLGIPTEPLTTQVVVHTGVVVALIWLGVASALEVYTYKRPLFSEIVLLIATLAVTIAFFNTYVYFSRIFVYPRIAVGLYAVFGSALLASSRAIKHSVQRALHRRGYGMRRVLIIGTGPIARRLARSFRRNHALGYQFLGFVSEHPEQGKDVIGSLENLERILDDTHAEEVIVALPGDQHQRTLEIAERCQDRHLRLRIVPDVFDVVMIRATLTEIDDIPLIGRAPGHKRLWLATGHGMMGVGMSAGTGQMLADLMAGRTPAVQPSAFDPARFA